MDLDSAQLKWKYVGGRETFRCPIFSIEEEQWTHSSLDSANFYVLNTRDWAVAIAMNENREVLMVRQFRFGVRRMTLEFPGGLIDANESPEAGSKRELLEETGYSGQVITALGSVTPNPAFQSNRCHYFLYEGLEQVHSGEPDTHESFELVWIPLNELDALVQSGQIEHGVVVNGIYFLRTHADL